MLNTFVALLATVLGATPPPGIDDADAIVLEGDVRFLGAIAPAEAELGKPFEIELWYKLKAPPPGETWTFMHLESLDSTCRLVEDRAPAWGNPPLADGYFHHKVTITVPKNNDCGPTTLEVFTGFWDRKTTKRLQVLEPRSLDDRIHAASIRVVDEPTAATPEISRPSDMKGKEFWAHWRPWYGYLGGTLASAALALLFFLRLKKRGPPPDLEAALEAAGSPTGKARPPWQKWLVTTAILGVPMMLSLLAARDFIKDDAYISFRYAHNLVTGHGLVFNPGDKLEGYTNFLWTLMMTPFEGLGWDLFQICELVGTALVTGLVVYLTRIAGLLMATDNGALSIKTGAWLWAGVWLGTSSSLGLWATSGMEQAVTMFLPVVAAWHLWKAPVAENPKGALLSGLFMGLGCMSRPEVHFIGLCLGTPLVLRTIIRLVRRAKLPPAERGPLVERAVVYWFAGLFALTIPFHLFRYLYYGSLFPNTFYVKTGASSLVMLEGLKKLREMFSFNGTGLLLVLAPLAFIKRDRLAEKLVSLAVALGFMFYLVKVGVDEMQWHRLYLPGLPFLVLLAMLGLGNLCGAVAAWVRNRRGKLAVWAVGWAVVATWVSLDFAYTYREMSGFNGRGDLTGNHHPDLGKYVTRHDRPGALVAFQDMGSTPYHAPDIDFLDFIGLVDGVVAHARYDYGLHAFLATEASARQPEFDADMRKYFYQRNPEWTILTTYVQGDANMKATTERFSKNPVPESLGDPLKHNGYQFGIYDERFEKSYVHVRTWARSAGYYLSLYRRKDLWEQTPGEVVLDAPPADLRGEKRTFARGLELIGSALQPTAKFRQEAFFTTWWKVPGPLEPDTWFFFHVESPTFRSPFDTIPGDFMYPADRWKPGQIIEHRVLFQMPPDMPPGEYKVWLGVYRRSTGERLPVVQGAQDGQQRVDLGTFTVEPLNPPFDSLIRRCYPEEQRAHPERIIDHHRPRME